MLKKENIYMVGGCVRDKMLGLSPKDIDYVVVNTKKEDMVKSGFRQVGKDFPVFLHPKTGDEYALARIEKKVGKGYKGFEFECENVSLEEDLKRRDLTINAMAINISNEELFDPYGGQKDIKNKILRHVSESFKEDPLRVLRVARFASRYSDFTVAKETINLMKEIADSGELKSLTPERVWKETEKALVSDFPEKYFEVLKECDALKEVFPFIADMVGVYQREDYHYEGDVFIHTMMVLKESVFNTKILDEEDKKMIRLGALLHDVGKCKTKGENLIQGKHPLHDSADVVEPIFEEIEKKIKAPKILLQYAKDLALIHQKIHAIKGFKEKSIVNLFNKYNLEKKEKKYNNYFDNLMLGCRSDAYGRLIKDENGLGVRPKGYEQEYIARKAFQAYNQNFSSEIVKEWLKRELLKKDRDEVLDKNNKIINPPVEYIKSELNRRRKYEIKKAIKNKA